MKVDLVMWTKNGESTLGRVFRRINSVVPSRLVNKRFIVDDHSTDKTRKLAKFYGWDVIFNTGKGISDGANTALKNIDSEYFCSFEQDLLLNPNWFNRIVKLIDEKTFAVSGVRFANQPNYLRTLQKYVYEKYLGFEGLPAWLRWRKLSSFTLGKTLDNTLWNTKYLRQMGGFPSLQSNVGIDTVLAYKALLSDLHWIVDYDVKSTHLRNSSIRHELKHQYWYGGGLKEIWRILNELGLDPPINKYGVIFRLFTSPAVGFFVSLKTLEPNIIWLHPMIRYYYVKGYLKGD